MESSLEIRLAHHSDAQRIADFNVAMAVETEDKALLPTTVLEGVKSLLAMSDSGFYLVAELDEAIVGCLMVTYEWSDWRDGRFWWIQSVYVVPSARRRGVFRCLYDKVADMARQRSDVCGLRLYVEQENHIAQQTYERLGMQSTPYRIFEQEFNR
jgi:ribosomal protein S18 acetylase RimI-like enzyme